MSETRSGILTDWLHKRAATLREMVDRVEARAGESMHAVEWRADAALHDEAAAEIARLTRELEEARGRERALREAHERSVGVFRRACEIATAAIEEGESPAVGSQRLRAAIESEVAEINALVAAATPPEEASDETR